MAIEVIIARYGLAALFFGAGLEGEAVVVTGGVLAHRGLLSLPGAMAAAAAGSFLADQIYFALGRRFRDHPRVRKVAAKPAFARAIAAFERHPNGFVFAFRFLYGLRTVSPIAIGTSRIPARRFVLLNALAAILWGISITSVGYFFGAGIERLFGRVASIGHVALAAAAIAALLFGLGWAVQRFRRRAPVSETEP